MLASQPGSTMTVRPVILARLAPIWRQEPSNWPAAHWANWPLLFVGSRAKLSRATGACLAASCSQPALLWTRPAKSGARTWTWLTSRGWPRRSARQGMPFLAPEGQARPEAGAASAWPAATTVVSSTLPVAATILLTRVESGSRSTIFDENFCIMVSRRGLVSEPRRERHGWTDLTAPGSPWPRTALDLAGIGARSDERSVSICGGARLRRTRGHAARRRSGPANRRSGISGGPLGGPARRPRGG